jgi:hypothetical protein
VSIRSLIGAGRPPEPEEARPTTPPAEEEVDAAEDAGALTPARMIHPLNRWKLAWDWLIIALVHCC